MSSSSPMNLSKDIIEEQETQGSPQQAPSGTSALHESTGSARKRRNDELHPPPSTSHTFMSLISEAPRASTATASTAGGSYATLYPAPPGSAHPVLAPRSAFHPDRAALLETAASADQVVLGAHGLAPSDDEPSPAVFARMSRSERKRFREKKRRSQVNKGFDDLMAVLLKVDPEVRAEVEESEKSGRKHQSRPSGGTVEGENPALNRVDLITRTIMTLEKMNQKNRECKERLAEISSGLDSSDAAAAARQAIKDDRVLLMIPFLTPSGPVISRPSATGANSMIPTTQEQQHHQPQQQLQQQQQRALGMQPVGPVASSFQSNAQFPPVGYAPQLSAAMSSRYATPIQGYPREESGFHQGYFRGIQDAAIGRRLHPDGQDSMGQRGRMI